MKQAVVFICFIFFIVVKSNINSIQDATCTTIKCNNGFCKETSEGPVCVCDEGFLGLNCTDKGPDFYHRRLVMLGLADPDVLAINDDLFILMGTANGLEFPIYESTDLINFQLKTTYRPSTIDEAHDYCFLWAPNLSTHGTGYDLNFVAQRVPKGDACPAAGEDVSVFYANAPDGNLIFGQPVLVGFGPGKPNGRIASGCNVEGCAETIRIDPAVEGPDDDRWLFYVWFQNGNNIASIPFSATSDVVINAGPAFYPTPPSDELINEAPELLSRNGTYYLFFSTAFFNSQYAMKYIMSTSIPDLTRHRIVRMHSIAQRNANGNLVQTHGSNSVVKRRGEIFNFFHQGGFDADGHFIGRSTFKQRLAFRPDGSIHTLNTVDIRWTQLPSSFQYSLDIVLKGGAVIGPCIAVGRIGSASNVFYTGMCPDNGNRMFDKGDIDIFRLYFSNDGTWKNHVDTPYDGASDTLAIYIPGGVAQQVAVRWNERVTGAKYSLDVLRSDGSWIQPCVGCEFLFNNIEYVFDGNCRSSSTFVQLQDIKTIRVCSAVNDDWSHAVCGLANYNSNMTHISIFIQ